jgi:enoyl-CoA hydratase
MSAALVRLTIADAVATLALNRPEKRNALTSAMLEDLIAAIGAVERDPSIRVLVLRGEGEAFCAGHDLREMQQHREAGGGVDHSLLQQLFERLDQHVNPTLAAVHGVALAGGCELALHCDIRIATPAARFGMPLARLGIVVPFVLAARLIKIAGSAAAADLLLTAELVDGEKAVQLGLATRLVPADRLEAETAAVAAKIAANAPLAVREMKRVLRAAAPSSAPASVDEFETARRRISHSEDVREGLRAFAERRAPVFHGL